MENKNSRIRASNLKSPQRIALDDPLAVITDDIKAAFKRDGVVMLENALDPQWLLLLELGLQRALNNSSQEKHLFFEGEEGEFIETIRNFEVIPEIRRLVYDSPVADLIGKLIGSENLWLYSDEFFIKEKGNAARTPWHQDTPYWPIQGNQIASAWISLDALTKAECLEYVAGSQRGLIYDGFNPSKVSEDPTHPHYDDSYPPLPDIEKHRDDYDIRSWEITPGDIIIAHPSVLHGGGPTSSSGRRRAITIRIYGDDICYATRPETKPTVPLTPGLSLSLKEGDPLRSPWYPRVRPIPDHLKSEWL